MIIKAQIYLSKEDAFCIIIAIAIGIALIF